ncbi:hypothetical protein ACLK19_03915 [Escherichia coli]
MLADIDAMASKLKRWHERYQALASALAERLEGGAISTLRLTVKKLRVTV